MFTLTVGPALFSMTALGESVRWAAVGAVLVVVVLALSGSARAARLRHARPVSAPTSGGSEAFTGPDTRPNPVVSPSAGGGAHVGGSGADVPGDGAAGEAPGEGSGVSEGDVDCWRHFLALLAVRGADGDDAEIQRVMESLPVQDFEELKESLFRATSWLLMRDLRVMAELSGRPVDELGEELIVDASRPYWWPRGGFDRFMESGGP